MSRDRVLTYLKYALLILPPAFYFLTVLRFSVNIPYMDDYNAILEFALRYLDAATFSEKLSLLFSQHNEHRIVFPKLATVVYYHLGGVIDLRALTIFGNLSLIGVALVIYGFSYRAKDRLLYFLPVTLLLFQFQYYETIPWAMAAMANFYVLLFAFTSLLLLTKDGWAYLALGLLAAALGLVTQGSGVFVLLAGGALLALKKEYKRLIAWSAVSAVLLAFYFAGYERPSGHHGVIETFLNGPIGVVEYFLTFIGSSIPLPFFAGLFFFAFFAFLTLKGYYRKNPAVYCLLLFMMMTAGATALTRSGFGVEQALSSRYRIVSAFFPIFSYMAAADYFELEGRKKAFALLLAATVVFNIVSSVANYGYFSFYKTELENRLNAWKDGDEGALLHPDQQKAGRILYESMRRELYRPD